MTYAYALFIWVAGEGIVLNVFPTMLDCKVHEATILKSSPGANTTCLFIEERKIV